MGNVTSHFSKNNSNVESVVDNKIDSSSSTSSSSSSLPTRMANEASRLATKANIKRKKLMLKPSDNNPWPDKSPKGTLTTCSFWLHMVFVLFQIGLCIVNVLAYEGTIPVANNRTTTFQMYVDLYVVPTEDNHTDFAFNISTPLISTSYNIAWIMLIYGCMLTVTSILITQEGKRCCSGRNNRFFVDYWFATSFAVGMWVSAEFIGIVSLFSLAQIFFSVLVVWLCNFELIGFSYLEYGLLVIMFLVTQGQFLTCLLFTNANFLHWFEVSMHALAFIVTMIFVKMYNGWSRSNNYEKDRIHRFTFATVLTTGTYAMMLSHIILVS
jgi:hypothetical protein